MTTSDWFETTRPLDGLVELSRNPGLRAQNIAGLEFRIARSWAALNVAGSFVVVGLLWGSGSCGGNLNSKRPSPSVSMAYC
jgi:hypothetical protein